ncbi:hypothetical protein, partial [Klebsiella pneumoniae]|uniref:hypothetical protein n=1 Tax=Klebsiella pneumoniae TaxID=573 RepID=UPI003B97EE3E
RAGGGSQGQVWPRRGEARSTRSRTAFEVHTESAAPVEMNISNNQPNSKAHFIWDEPRFSPTHTGLI